MNEYTHADYLEWGRYRARIIADSPSKRWPCAVDRLRRSCDKIKNKEFRDCYFEAGMCFLRERGIIAPDRFL